MSGDALRFRATLVLLTFAGVTLPLMPVQQLFIWFWPRMPPGAFPMQYHRLVLRLLGVRIVRRDGETLRQGPAISLRQIMCPGSTYRDPRRLAPVSFVAKHDMAKYLALLRGAGAAAAHRVC